ncbi:MAG: aminoacyl-tRNA hydrolase [Bacteroidales bacterium]|nr:aminoacyl-tRNA hydrolase [Candidatus Physcocola equi]
MKYLIVGLGNIGPEYQNTRHNTGFKVLDAYAQASNLVFETNRYGDIARCRVKNAELVLLKPNTFMNLSGNAVRYWLDAEKIPLENLLVIVDDIAIPFGQLRLKGSGGAGGHNGLKNIEACVKTAAYARLRFGIGGNFPKGQQIEHVLGAFTEEESAAFPARAEIAGQIINSFCLAGLELTMTQFNKK